MMKSLFLAAALVVAASPAQAHKLKLFVSAEGAEMVGTAYFAGGGKAAGLEGHLIDAEGRVVANLRTDAEGGFRVTPPDGRAYRVRFESGDGHMAETAFGGSAGAAPPPSAVSTSGAAVADSAQLEAAIARQLTPLRQQLDAMDSRARLSDIVGGVGLIVGLFGFWAWWQARRRGNGP